MGVTIVGANGIHVQLGNGIMVEISNPIALLIVALIFVLLLYSLSIIRYAIKTNFYAKSKYLDTVSETKIDYYDKMADYKSKMSTVVPDRTLKPSTILKWIIRILRKSK